MEKWGLKLLKVTFLMRKVTFLMRKTYLKVTFLMSQMKDKDISNSTNADNKKDQLLDISA